MRSDPSARTDAYGCPSARLVRQYVDDLGQSMQPITTGRPGGGAQTPPCPQHTASVFVELTGSRSTAGVTLAGRRVDISRCRCCCCAHHLWLSPLRSSGAELVWSYPCGHRTASTVSRSPSESIRSVSWLPSLL